MRTTETIGVDFIGIGSPRCGTTWVFRCIEDHPDICSAYLKEVAFFSQDDEFAKGIGAYKKYFEHASPDKALGEFSPEYLSDPRVPARIKQNLPDVKLIASLRNPADSLYSMYHFGKQRGKYSYPTFEDFLAGEPQQKEDRLYMKHLNRYLEEFPAEQLLVLIFEDIERDPRLFMKGVYEFLGVDPSFVSTYVEKRINAGESYGVFFLSRIMYKVIHLLRRTEAGSRLVSLLFHSRLKAKSDALFEMNKDKGGSVSKRPVMQEQTRAELLAFYSEDVAALERFIGRDLSVWR
ncbi:MAG: sulfotransferase [Kiritimatiellia bacterium]|jgi:hypothetical protein|nr:sulfotransferase [Kiritimatiellia bacterium]